MTTPRARILAHYLPQFHPTRDNDEFWGPGFTEWTSIATAQKSYRGYMPEIPGELGFYDLRLPETRAAQAELARDHGIEGFLYWHYWFAGQRTLERPFMEVLESGAPNFPFCLAWANHNWTRVWQGKEKELLIEQTYPGPEDTRRHFAALESAFHDPRYVRVDDRPLFFLFRPQDVPNLPETLDLWRQLAQESGLRDLYFMGRIDGCWDPSNSLRVARTLDGVTDYSLGYLGQPPPRKIERIVNRLIPPQRRKARQYPYQAAVSTIPRLSPSARASYPTVIPGWDSTPRHRGRGFALTGRTPEAFGEMLSNAIDLVTDRPLEHRIVFLKSWNEWAEGNFIEPDRHFGRAFLEACQEVALAK